MNASFSSTSASEAAAVETSSLDRHDCQEGSRGVTGIAQGFGACGSIDAARR